MIEVLYRDEDLIIVNKPSGMMVHPWKGRKSPEKTLLHVLKDQEELYLYPLHRLDRPVSGVIVFGLTKKATSVLKENWNGDETKKEYISLVRGRIVDSGKFDHQLRNDRGKYQQALTHYDPLHYFPEFDASLLSIKISTGRKHQIRRHFSRYNYNLIGDTKYGKGSLNIIYREMFSLNRIFLHARKLSFIHPIKNTKIEIKAPLATDLVNTLTKMGMSQETILSLSQ
ncbi:MAG: hypothetical protein GY909_02575 [Oligoflexia bacterium]|nr:hypothetical protein [Oligoflexia bacterium]